MTKHIRKSKTTEPVSLTDEQIAALEPTAAEIAAVLEPIAEPVLTVEESDAIVAAYNLTPAALVEAANEAVKLDEPIEITTKPTPPTADEIAAVLETIDPAAETSVTAGVVDHESQAGSWISEETAAEIQLDEVVAELTETAERCEETIPFPESDEAQAPTLAQKLASVPDEDVDRGVFKIAASVDDRAAFETEIESGPNIHSTLKKIRTQLVTKRAARLMLAINVDANFLNRTVHTGARYNVYAAGKLGDIVYGVTDGVVANAINVACMKSLFAFNKAGVPFTMECAKGAASKNYARGLDPSVRKHLISHTVAPGTAPTQASSTMQALVTLGVVKTNGAGKNPTYTVLDTPIAHKLEGMLAAA